MDGPQDSDLFLWPGCCGFDLGSSCPHNMTQSPTPNNSLLGHLLPALPHTLGTHSSSIWCSQTSWLWLTFFISHYFNCCIWIHNRKPRDSVTMGSFWRFKAAQQYTNFLIFKVIIFMLSFPAVTWECCGCRGSRDCPLATPCCCTLWVPSVPHNFPELPSAFAQIENKINPLSFLCTYSGILHIPSYSSTSMFLFIPHE